MPPCGRGKFRNSQKYPPKHLHPKALFSRAIFYVLSGVEPDHSGRLRIPHGRERGMATSLVKVLVHIVFSTKNRAPLIDATLKADLYPYMAGIVRPDGRYPARPRRHARPRPCSPSSQGGSQTVGSGSVSQGRILEMASRTTRARPRIRMAEGLRRVLRQPVQGGGRAVLHLKQEAHHRQASYEQELIGLLKKHRIEFDLRDLFD